MNYVWKFMMVFVATLALGAVAQSAAPPMEVRGVTLASLHRSNIGYGSESCREQLDVLADLGCNWVALCDFAWMQSVDDPAVRYRAGDSPEGDLAQTIRDANARGIKVMVKPHIWSRDFGNGADWHGTIAMTNEADWATFFENYTTYIVAQAKIAQTAGADALCVGVEMKAASHREADWRKLISEVRKHFDGALTYGANTDEYQQVTWWDALDCYRNPGTRWVVENPQ